MDPNDGLPKKGNVALISNIFLETWLQFVRMLASRH